MYSSESKSKDATLKDAANANLTGGIESRWSVESVDEQSVESYCEKNNEPMMEEWETASETSERGVGDKLRMCTSTVSSIPPENERWIDKLDSEPAYLPVNLSSAYSLTNDTVSCLSIGHNKFASDGDYSGKSLDDGSYTTRSVRV